MYSLFSKVFEGSFPSIKPPAFDIVKRIYQREISTITNYYNSRVFAVKGNHFLCRLLNTAIVPIEYDLARFMEIVYARAPYVANTFQMTSERAYGIFHNGVFYGPGNQELIIYNEEYFNPFEALENWKSLKPIKVLQHQISDFGLMLPDGDSNSTGQGFCSVTINVPLLLCMYRGFLQEQKKKSVEGADSILGVTHFVHMYVLPSMMESHVDIVVLNRMINLLDEKEMSQPLQKHAFPVVDYSARTDVVLGLVMNHLENKKMSYFGYLQNIPSVCFDDMQKSLVMPDIAKTRQAWWALNLSRLNVMSLLIKLGGENATRSNGTEINEMIKIVRYLSRENMLKTLLPPMLYVDVSVFIQDILAI